MARDVQGLMDEMAPRIHVQPVDPPRPAPPLSPLGVNVSVRPSLRATKETIVYVSNMEIARHFEVERDSTVLIITDPRCAYRGASRLSIKSAGSVRIISMCPGKHQVGIAGTRDAIEFDGVVGANCEIRDGVVVGLFRAQLSSAREGGR